MRTTPAEKFLAQELVELFQVLTHKNITVSTLLRTVLNIALSAGQEKLLKAIKKYNALQLNYKSNTNVFHNDCMINNNAMVF